MNVKVNRNRVAFVVLYDPKWWLNLIWCFKLQIDIYRKLFFSIPIVWLTFMEEEFYKKNQNGQIE
jgi:hypothetical protein